MNNLRPKNESLARYYRPKTFEEINPCSLSIALDANGTWV